MNIDMNMNYEKIEEPSTDVEYDDEILSTGWNPAVELVGQEHLQETESTRVVMPPDLTTEVVDIFLRKMYSMQR
jgi:hypothetical protein